MKRKIIFILFLISTLMMSGCSTQEKETLQMSKQQKTYAEIAETIKNFEINGITTELIQKLETQYSQLPPEIEFNKTAHLLASLGNGTFNYSEGTWTPSTNGVYSFDVEIFNVDTMYTNFLMGVSALNKEELNFQNIKEDTSDVNWENGTGKRTVSFDWNEKNYILHAKVENDWFDLNVANELNKIIIENNNDKQLFFTSDNYQECIVFYRSKEWASHFQKETGLILSEFN